MPSEDQMTQEVAKRELAMENKKKRRLRATAAAAR